MAAAVGSVMNALKYVPASVGVQLLSKFNPKFKNYFSQVASYGLDVNRALDYVVSKFNNPNAEQFEDDLDRQGAQGTLRPDEMVARSEIANSKIPGRTLQAAASFGAAGLLPGGNTQMQPQENESQPMSLGGNPNPRLETQEPLLDENFTKAQPIKQYPQGTNPSSPKVKTETMQKFLAQKQAQGSPLQGSEDQLGSYFKKFPGLTNFLQKQINAGKSAREAANIAKASKIYSNAVKTIEQDLNKDFGELIEYVFGASTQPSPAQQPKGAGKSELIQSMQQMTALLQNMKGRK